jgi:hypothetical protein
VNSRVLRAVCKLFVPCLETESSDNCPGMKQNVVKLNSKSLFSSYSKAKAYLLSGLHTGCGRNNSHISKGDYKQMVRGITKNISFPKCRYQKVFSL